MPFSVDAMPKRGRLTPQAYEKAMIAWRSQNKLPTKTIIPPVDGELTALKPRTPSGAYTNTPPSRKPILPDV